MVLPSTTPGSTPWDPGPDLARPPTYYKGEHATRIDDILVSASLTRAKCLGGYTTMGKEHPMNGSDHRAVIMHCDINSFIGMGRPRPIKDDVKQRIRAMTSALERRDRVRRRAAQHGRGLRWRRRGLRAESRQCRRERRPRRGGRAIHRVHIHVDDKLPDRAGPAHLCSESVLMRTSLLRALLAYERPLALVLSGDAGCCLELQ